MSTALAIASVTHVLKDLLNDGMIDHDVSGVIGGNVAVSALPPDRIDTSEANTESRLNLYMYQAVPNTSWKNIGFPSRNTKGERISNPPLALNLHYLLTAYGADEYHAEILLGYGMQLLHETPVLSRDAIRTSLAPPTPVSGGGLPPELLALSTSELAEQVEQIRIVHNTLNTEELSKLWTTFESKYRPTAAYQVSVVLIESKKSTKQTLPVRERQLYVIPFDQPVVEKIKSQSAPGEPIIENQKILEGYNLVVEGRQLRGEVVSVDISGIDVTPDPDNLKNTQIIIPLPAGLFAGIQGVRVIHRILMGSPPEPHRGVESNVEAFVLSPRIESTTVTITGGTGDDPRSADIELEVNPAIKDTQKVVLLLNEFIPGPVSEIPRSYSFYAPPLTLMSPPGPFENILIPVNGVQAGTYLVRIQVDGAESPLGTDLTGKYNSPLLTIL
ncbi:MAG: DUF4255 domain-containing protein [Bacteroidales bacterium]